jgi:lipoprotein signal peptidase
MGDQASGLGVRRGLLVVLIAICVVAIDQVTKSLSHDGLVWYSMGSLGNAMMAPHDRLIGPFSIWPIRNTVGSAGYQITGIGSFRLTLITTIPLLALLWRFVKARGPKLPLIQWLSLGFLVGGSAGNLIDLVRFGYARDFISLPSLGIFNVADIAITIGMVMLLIDGIVSPVWRHLRAGRATAVPEGT